MLTHSSENDFDHKSQDAVTNREYSAVKYWCGSHHITVVYP